MQIAIVPPISYTFAAETFRPPAKGYKKLQGTKQRYRENTMEHTTDTTILHNIDSLVKEEHTLMNQAENGGLTEEQHAHMTTIQVQLDQCWDLLRQRRAKREFGFNPDEAEERPAEIVEHYQQ